MHKQLIKKMIETGKQEDMEYLEDLLVDLVCDLKTTDLAEYKQVEYDMYKRVYGNHLNEALAKEWVAEMQNKDGTTGEHWTYEQTSSLANGFDKCDFYAVLNMIYSDFYNAKFDTNTYVELAKDWLNDKDIEDGKALKYYMFVVR